MVRLLLTAAAVVVAGLTWRFGYVVWPLCLCLSGLIYVVLGRAQAPTVSMAKSDIDVVAIYRHRMANRLQVLSGWLSLGRDDRARAELRAMTDEMRLESALWSTVPEERARRLIGVWMAAERAGRPIALVGAPTERATTLSDETVRLAQAMLEDGRPFTLYLGEGRWRVEAPATQEVAATRDDGR